MFAVLGGLGYVFFNGDGFGRIVVTRPPSEQAAAPSAGETYQGPGQWEGPPTPPRVETTNAGPILPPGAQPQDGGARQPTIRIASFNIQVFGNKKASKQLVMDTLADIVQLFDVVAIQEIRSKNEYLIPNFVNRINQSGKKFDHVIGPRVGFTVSKEQYAYLYNSETIEVDHHSVYTIGDPDGLLHRPPLVATFRTRVDPAQAFTFTLINTHTDPGAVEGEVNALAEVYRVVRRASRGEDDIIMLGDFNTDDRHLGRLGQLPGTRPLVVGKYTNTRQTKQYDNLIIHQPSTTEYAGNWGVLNIPQRYGLSVEKALEISDHLPVWAEFSIYELDSNGRVATRRPLVRR